MEEGKCLSTEKGRSRGKIKYGKLRKRRQKNGHVIVTFQYHCFYMFSMKYDSYLVEFHLCIFYYLFCHFEISSAY